MSEPAIRMAALGKAYRIGALEDRARYRTLREIVARAAWAPARRAARLLRGEATGAAELDTVVWALKDVSLEVARGEVLGIVGRNGAGKSTLLKILSRITEPTEGHAEIRGRVGSLLEVGTGFHPELTGRENIYLNGAILGMRKREIERKFDEMVSFAEIERFLDTPVKHYSTGMYVRLAFAVAAHLEPEILLVDEVLAVGDTAFQRKCLGKMGAAARQGRTVLFVSHNLGAVQNLCGTGVWIEEGRVVVRGGVGEAVKAYLRSVTQVSDGESDEWRRTGTGGARVVGVRLLDAAGHACEAFGMGETVAVEYDIEFDRFFSRVQLALEVRRVDTGLPVLHLTNEDEGFELRSVGPGRRRVRVALPQCLLYPSSYAISLWVASANVWLDYVLDVATFSMVQGPVSRRTAPFHPDKGVYHQAARWEVDAMMASRAAAGGR